MDIKKLSLGTLLGGLVYFFVGWLVYGIVMKNQFVYPEGISVPDDQMNMGFMVISCLLFGALLAYILQAMGKMDWTSGALAGAIIAALVSLSVGFGQAAMLTFGSAKMTFMDAIANAICGGLAGAIIGWYYGRK